MGSYKRPKPSYNSDDLNQLQWVLDIVWFIFETRYPHRDKANDENLKGSLRRRLFALAGAGVNDLETLEANLIDSIPPDYEVTLSENPENAVTQANWREPDSGSIGLDGSTSDTSSVTTV